MRTKLIVISFLLLLALNPNNNTNDVVAHAPADKTILENADDHCNNPTMEIIIAADGPASYDRDVIEVPKDTCITIFFLNVVDYPHNFLIEPVDDDVDFDVVWMDLENSTAVCGQAGSDHGDTPGQARFNIKTPKVNTDIEYYCSYPEH
ncbi:MAG: hypothetical protein ACW99A_20290, partial [Candidatus Kariarchaeaceae archaeon]